MTAHAPGAGATLTVVVPAHNEAESLPATLRELKAVCEPRGWRIVVVDDGSEDDTLVLAREAGVEVVHHKVRRGYGGAVKSGLARADTDLVATFDADGQHDPGDLPAMVVLLEEADADMVTGSRQGPSASLYRATGKWLIRAIARLLLPMSIQDLNTGLRVLRADLGRRYLPLLPDSPAFCDVLTMAFIADRHRVVEHAARALPRTAGRSKMSTQTALETVVEILNMITLFNPLRIFLPLSVTSIVVSALWGVPYVLRGRGVSVGAMLGIVTGVILFALGLLAEQLAAIRRRQAARDSAP